MVAKINKRTAIVIATVVTIVLIVTAAFVYLSINSSPKQLESITISNNSGQFFGGLLSIAQNKSYFAQNGLNVTFQPSTSGVVALNDLSSGKVDVATSTEFPVVSRLLSNDTVSVIAVYTKTYANYIIAPADRGIQNASDLVNKKIEVISGTILPFYLDRYLSLNNIDESSVDIVNVSATVLINQQIDALVNGTVDALAGAQPAISLVQQRTGGNVTALSIQEGQPAFLDLVCRNDWIASHPQTIENLLKALYQAEQYYQSNPSQAQLIIQQFLNMTNVDPVVWSNAQFKLSLDQTLVIAMKDEAQWMINNHLTNQTQVPNFVDHIYTDGLKAVKTDAVTVIK